MSVYDWYIKMMKARMEKLSEIEKEQFDKAERLFACTGQLSIASLPKVTGKQNEAILLSDMDPLSGLTRTMNQLDHREDGWLSLLGVSQELIDRPYGAISFWQKHVLKVNVKVRREDVTRFGCLKEGIESGCITPKHDGDYLADMHPLTLAIRRAMGSILHCRIERLVIHCSKFSEKVEVRINLLNFSTNKREIWVCDDTWHVGVLIQNWKQEMSEMVHCAELVFRPPSWVEFDGVPVGYGRASIVICDDPLKERTPEEEASRKYLYEQFRKKSEEK